MPHDNDYATMDAIFMRDVRYLYAWWTLSLQR